MSDPSIESLLQHADWVRALARRLVRDAAQADDLIQEAWLAAPRQPPQTGEGSAPRAWLGTVLRRTAKASRHRELRRSQREAAVAGDAQQANPHELAERASLQQELSAMVLKLGEPYRDVLLLRWWEGLPPRKIAAQLGLPIATVNTRLQRAHQKLRDQLEDQHGDQGRWCMALTPLLRGPILPAAGPGLGLAISTTAKGALGGLWGWALALGLAAGSLALLRHWTPALFRAAHPPSQQTQLAKSAPPGLASSRASSRAFQSESPGERRALNPIEQPSHAPSQAPPLDGVEWTLVDWSGQAMGGVRLRRQDPRVVDWSGGDPVWIGNAYESLHVSLDTQQEWVQQPSLLQAFCEARRDPEAWLAAQLGTPLPELEFLTGRQGQMKDEDPSRVDMAPTDWTLVASGLVQAQGQLVAVPAVTLAGVVLDSQGRPLQHATLGLDQSVESTLYRRFDEVLTIRRPKSTRSDSQGRFVLRKVPCFPGSAWSLHASNHRIRVSPVPSTSQLDLVVRMKAPPSTQTQLRGTVRSEDGTALPGVHVHYKGLHTETDADGNYRLYLEQPQVEGPLCAWGEGLSPWLDPSTSLEPTRDSEPARFRKDLVLKPAGAALRGRVMDARGQPIANAQIGLRNSYCLRDRLRSLEAAAGARAEYVLSDEHGQFELTVPTLEGDVQLRVATTHQVFHPPPLAYPAQDPAEIWIPDPAQADPWSGSVGPGPHGLPQHVRARFDWLRSADGEGAIFGGMQTAPLTKDGSFRFPSSPDGFRWLDFEFDDPAHNIRIDLSRAPYSDQLEDGQALDLNLDRLR